MKVRELIRVQIPQLKLFENSKRLISSMIDRIGSPQRVPAIKITENEEVSRQLPRELAEISIVQISCWG